MTCAEESDREAILARTDIRPSMLAHLVFKTPRYEEMRDFYLTLLNARVVHEASGLCFMTYDSEHHRIVVIAMPHLSPLQPGAAGLEHFAFTYATLGELLGNYLRLKERGVDPAWCINHGFTTSIYYRDPDGNMIETQFDNMTVPEADAFMKGEYFAKNPIGVDFDPELLCRRYRDGDPVAALTAFRAAPYAAGAAHIRPPGVPPYDADGELL
jgi:catechol 2,3-dioxygenase-like lactoylglutathione lyase family enzyme